MLPPDAETIDVTVPLGPLAVAPPVKLHVPPTSIAALEGELLPLQPIIEAVAIVQRAKS